MDVADLTVPELLHDFRSIKLSKAQRAWVDRLWYHFETHGSIPNREKFALVRLSKKYSKQFAELHASRDRARRTNALRKMGVSREEFKDMQEERKRKNDADASDLGF